MAAKAERKKTLVEAAVEVLNEGDPVLKARLGDEAATQWLQGHISLPHDHADVPDRPARLPTVKVLPSHMMPKLGKGGSLRSRQAILHSLVHTESWAIDLSWDIIARFGHQGLPREFFTDFVRVAQDEGRHFTLLSSRLCELGSFYGAFPTHDGLWDSAIRTSGDLLSRLAIEHCVHEARGLDVLPSIISRFRNGGDECTAKLLESVVYPEEVTHCAAGVKWFRYFCLRKLGKHPPKAAHIPPGCISSQISMIGECLSKEEADGATEDGAATDESWELVEGNGCDEVKFVIPTFHATVRRYFRGPLKPPFNEEARKAAGFAPEWYEPMATKDHEPPTD